MRRLLLFDSYFELDKSTKGIYYHHCMSNYRNKRQRSSFQEFLHPYNRNMNRIDKYILNYID